jgi:hypothetical protein
VSESPIITPAQFLSLEGVSEGNNDCDVAVVGFRPFHDLKDKASAVPEPLTRR